MPRSPDASTSPHRFIMRMQWHHLLFAHWSVEAESLRPLVPDVFELDTFDGRAWIGLVPFTMRDVSPRYMPRIPWPGVTDFHECNVRTYVRHRGEPAVWFFSLDAASRLAVWGARTIYHLPYKYARMALTRCVDEIDYAVDRMDEPKAHLRCTWRAGKPRPRAQPGNLDHFLTERYQLVTVDGSGRPLVCRIFHEPWLLRDAEIIALDDGLVRAAGITLPAQPPILYHADRLDVLAGPPLRT